MAGSLNKVTLIGNLGKDPEIRKTQDGRPIGVFSLATTESWKDKSGERRDKTEWHNIVVFNEGLCGVIEKYVKKGSKVYIEGQLQTRKWQDKDGNDKYTTEVVLQGFSSQLIMLDGRNQTSSSSGGGSYDTNQVSYDSNFGMGGGDVSKKASAGSFSHELDDDIPF